MMKTYCVYILASQRNGTLYVGSTSNLIKRIEQHQSKVVSGFTKKYSVTKLVYFEEHQYVSEMIRREKRLKNWCRKWKLDLIEKTNPEWDDLFERLQAF